MDENKGLLIAALVAIVAVVGLVMLVQGGGSGAAICGSMDMVQLGNGQFNERQPYL